MGFTVLGEEEFHIKKRKHREPELRSLDGAEWPQLCGCGFWWSDLTPTSVVLAYRTVLRTGSSVGGYMGGLAPGPVDVGYQLPTSYLGMPAAWH